MQGTVNEVAALVARGDGGGAAFFRTQDCTDADGPLSSPSLLAIGKRYFTQNGLRVVRHCGSWLPLLALPSRPAGDSVILRYSVRPAQVRTADHALVLIGDGCAPLEVQFVPNQGQGYVTPCLPSPLRA
jgi:hypothetical protein